MTMLKFHVSIALCLFHIGCAGPIEHPVNETMLALSEAVHQRDASALTKLLSKQTISEVTDLHNQLRDAFTASEGLPTTDRNAMREGLPAGVKNNKPESLLTELLEKRIGSLRLNEQTLFGLIADKLDQVSSNSLTVVTKSGQRLAFVLEDNQWKVHLFAQTLAKLTKDAKSLKERVALATERHKRRLEIEAAIKDNK